MKRLLLLSVFLIFFVKSNAQNFRYMYLAIGDGSTTYLVDTVNNDNKQFAAYQFRNNIVLIWVKIIQKDNLHNQTFTGSLSHFAVDTTNSQTAIVSVVTYKDGNVTNSGNINLQWSDIVPGSIGEEFVSYCKSLHNLNLKLNLMKNGAIFEINHSWTYKFL